MDFVLFVWCKKGGIECVVDSPCFEEAELVCDRREDFDNCEESFLFKSELEVCDGAFEISGF